MDKQSIRGRVYKFGDNINTDMINPAQYMELSMEVMIAHAMEGSDPDFSKKVRPGDILVVGKNFGSGSSRETAPMVIQGSGISLIIAEQYARIFYRNAINIGLKVLTCDAVDELRDGDELEVFPAKGVIKNLTTQKQYQCPPLPGHILELVNDGGLINHLDKKLNHH